MIKKRFIAMLATLILLIGCSEKVPPTTGVYMLLDTSGTYTKQLLQAKAIINYLLGNLHSGDSFAVARIDSGSFSEKDILAKVTFDQRPSVANQQKVKFKSVIEKFVKRARGSTFTDIKGGLLQAVDYLNETGAGHKYILIFSDMKEDLARGHKRNLNNIELDLTKYTVVALNVTKLGSDQANPEQYYKRLNYWKKVVTERGGTWRKLDDIKRPETILRKK